MTSTPTIGLAGSGALLLDAASGPFAHDVQERIWALAKAALGLPSVVETVPGMNNLLVVFDPLSGTPSELMDAILAVWRDLVPGGVLGRTIEVPVEYGGLGGEDLAEWAHHCGLSVLEAVHRHAAATYSVAAIGSMPGFPYLSGLDPMLAWARRAVPRARVAEGAVIVGGAQAGIMSQAAPSGWHVLGSTPLKLFDLSVDPPALLLPGDLVRFAIAGIVP